MIVLRNGIDISDTDIKVLQNDLLNIEDWINGAIAGKIASCKTRMIESWTPRLLADPDVDIFPANEAALINMITERPDYMSRADNEAALLDMMEPRTD